MKKVFPLFLIVFALILTAFNTDDKEKFPTIKNGSKLPLKNEKMLDISGEKFSLADLKGENGTLIIFSCNTCPFVINWEDRYREVEALSKRVNVGLVYINPNENQRQGVDSYEAMKEHAGKYQYSAPYLVDVDSKVANAFGAKTTPHIFLFDKNDKLVYQGSIDDNSKDKNEVKEKYLQNALMNLQQGKAINPDQTKAVGCSIKRVK
jgi:thioredoxin-related protein